MINSFWQLYITANSQWLIVIIFRLVGVEQPREGELECGGVALNQLRGDVEVGVVPTITRAQRPRRHVEKVKARQPERVRGRGRDGRAYSIYTNAGKTATFRPLTLTRNMRPLPIPENTSRTFGSIMANQNIQYALVSHLVTVRLNHNPVACAVVNCCLPLTT